MKKVFGLIIEVSNLASRYHLKVKINFNSVFDPGICPILERVATCRTGGR
jgi:hypothetical protein